MPIAATMWQIQRGVESNRAKDGQVGQTGYSMQVVMERSRFYATAPRAVALLLMGFASFVGSVAARDDAPADVPPEVELSDIYGARHYLGDFVDSQTKAIVMVVLDDKCPVVQLTAPKLVELYKKHNAFAKDRAGRPTEFSAYPGDRVQFLGIYVKRNLGAKGMAAHAAERRLPFRVLHDPDLEMVNHFGLRRLSEVVVCDRNWRVTYRGPVDDQYVQGSARPAASQHYLSDAIDAVLAGRAVAVPRRPAVGCRIDLRPPGRSDRKLTFHSDVAPILQRHCQACHRDGEVAPMPLVRFADVNHYAAMVAEVVRDRRMPPYPGMTTREFANDERLTDAERDTLLAWLGGERAEGDAAESPPPVHWPSPEHWRIGNPDFVFRMPKPFTVPATGVLNYVYIPVAVNGGKGFAEDRWISAIETHPGARQVVHHVQIHEYFGPIDREPTALDQVMIYGLGIESARLLGSYTPGNEEGNKLVFSRYLSEQSRAAGQTAGMKLSKGANLMFEVHYTTNGTAVPDQSEVAIKFADKQPDVVLDTWFPFRSRADMIVPANVQNHSLQDLYHFGRETNGRAVLLHGIRPHMHSRGKSFRVELIDPRKISRADLTDFAQHDRVRGEAVLTIPVWDFNWQRFYQFKEPILIRPDQALLATAYWDNTRHNPRNPDATADTPWGQQTIHEMFNTLMLYEIVEPGDPRLEAEPGASLAGGTR